MTEKVAGGEHTRVMGSSIDSSGPTQMDFELLADLKGDGDLATLTEMHPDKVETKDIREMG